MIALGRHIHGKYRPLRSVFEFSLGEVNGEAARQEQKGKCVVEKEEA